MRFEFWLITLVLIACASYGRFTGPSKVDATPGGGICLPRVEHPLPERHDPYCREHRAARIEYLRESDLIQRAQIQLGTVVYIAGSGCLHGAEFSPDEKAGRTVWLGGGAFGPDPVPGKSWCCKNCHQFWGEFDPEWNLLDHP